MPAMCPGPGLRADAKNDREPQPWVPIGWLSSVRRGEKSRPEVANAIKSRVRFVGWRTSDPCAAKRHSRAPISSTVTVSPSITRVVKGTTLMPFLLVVRPNK